MYYVDVLRFCPFMDISVGDLLSEENTEEMNVVDEPSIIQNNVSSYVFFSYLSSGICICLLHINTMQHFGRYPSVLLLTLAVFDSITD